MSHHTIALIHTEEEVTRRFTTPQNEESTSGCIFDALDTDGLSQEDHITLEDLPQVRWIPTAGVESNQPVVELEFQIPTEIEDKQNIKGKTYSPIADHAK
jgi:hypothetical protein